MIWQTVVLPVWRGERRGLVVGEGEGERKRKGKKERRKRGEKEKKKNRSQFHRQGEQVLRNQDREKIKKRDASCSLSTQSLQTLYFLQFLSDVPKIKEKPINKRIAK